MWKGKEATTGIHELIAIVGVGFGVWFGWKGKERPERDRIGSNLPHACAEMIHRHHAQACGMPLLCHGDTLAQKPKQLGHSGFRTDTSNGRTFLIHALHDGVLPILSVVYAQTDVHMALAWLTGSPLPLPDGRGDAIRPWALWRLTALHDQPSTLV
jgi:hypothetical protein